ncbi:MAG: DUF3592 domain-containing protein [Armatimonadetes bacterium]|nr:DUF3592 domain-containing protein [Armatimonadota bacterium]
MKPTRSLFGPQKSAEEQQQDIVATADEGQKLGWEVVLARKVSRHRVLPMDVFVVVFTVESIVHLKQNLPPYIALSRHGVLTQGRIIQTYSKSGIQQSDPSYEFLVNGSWHQVEGRTTNGLKEGQTVSVLYDPSNLDVSTLDMSELRTNVGIDISILAVLVFFMSTVGIKSRQSASPFALARMGILSGINVLLLGLLASMLYSSSVPVSGISLCGTLGAAASLMIMRKGMPFWVPPAALVPCLLLLVFAMGRRADVLYAITDCMCATVLGSLLAFEATTIVKMIQGKPLPSLEVRL